MSNRWLAVAVVVLATGACKKVIEAEQFLEVDQLVATDPASLAGTPLRVHGFVKRGTISSRVRDQKSSLMFLATTKDKVIRVVYAGPAPDKFQDQAEIIVRGTLVPATGDVPKDSPYLLEATELLAKCPTNYDRGKGPAPTQYQ